MAHFDRKVWKQLPPRCFSPIACFTLVCSLFQVHHKTPEWRVHSKKHPNDASVTFLSKEGQCTDLKKKKRCICLHNLKDWMLILVYLHSHSLQLTETYRTCTFYFEKWVGYTVIFVGSTNCGYTFQPYELSLASSTWRNKHSGWFLWGSGRMKGASLVVRCQQKLNSELMSNRVPDHFALSS